MQASEVVEYAEAEQDKMLEIVKLQAEGRTQTYIQQQTGATRREQKQVLEQYREFVNKDSWIQTRAREATAMIDTHYTSLIAKFYEAEDDAISSDDYKTRASILKQIADVEKQRIQFLTNAGILSAQSIGDQIVDIEEQKETIKAILKETAQKFPEAAKFIAQKLAELDGQVVAERVFEES